MTRHIDLLGTLYLIWGALSLVISVALVALGLAALAILGSGGSSEPGATLAASFLAILFLSLAALALLWGGVHLWAAFALHHGRDWARAVGIVLGLLNLVLLPFGTALGAYALWVLARTRAPGNVEPSGA
jgi:hypothetical protein